MYWIHGVISLDFATSIYVCIRILAHTVLFQMYRFEYAQTNVHGSNSTTTVHYQAVTGTPMPLSIMFVKCYVLCIIRMGSLLVNSSILNVMNTSICQRGTTSCRDFMPCNCMMRLLLMCSCRITALAGAISRKVDAQLFCVDWKR